MSLSIDKWPRIVALTITLVFLILTGGTNSSASSPQQIPPLSPDVTLQPQEPILLTDPVPDPKQTGVMWFAPTGHTLRGAFLDYWNKYGGLAQFGYPLTEEFFEPVGADNKLYQVQYFERNRFELHPENAGSQYEVLLGVLGLDFRKADPPATPVTGAQYFSETGHTLSGKFKEYWDTHGGLFVHGYPIIEAQLEKSTDGKEYQVQWFERSRFELHPESAGSKHKVLLGLLGVQLVQQERYSVDAYPLYGYAADFSWIAGRITRYASVGSAQPDAGCSIFQYGTTDQRVQLNNSRGGAYIIASLQLQNNIVAFGRMILPNEPKAVCVFDDEVPIYYVEHRLQLNPNN